MDAVDRWGGEQKEKAPTLHHVPGTISSPIAQALIELGVASVTVKTLSFPELKQPAHLAINPLGTSPAFSDGDLCMWESHAVLTHILETYDPHHILHPPPRSAQRAHFLQLQAFLLITVYPTIASLFLHTLKPSEEQDSAFVAAGKQKWADSIAPILVAALGDQKFLFGNEMSAVDLIIAKPLRNAKALGVLQAFPTLEALFDRISSRPSFAQAYAIA